MTLPVPSTPTRALPDPQRLLAWVFGGRALLAATALVLAVVTWSDEPGVWPAVGLGVLAATALTAYAYWSVWRKGRLPSERFLFCQAAGDVLLVTLLVHFARGADSVFPSIYILVVAAYALLMSFGGGLLVALLIGAAYLTDAMWLQDTRPGLAFWGQIGVFLIFAPIYLVSAGLLAFVARETHPDKRHKAPVPAAQPKPPAAVI